MVALSWRWSKQAVVPFSFLNLEGVEEEVAAYRIIPVLRVGSFLSPCLHLSYTSHKSMLLSPGSFAACSGFLLFFQMEMVVLAPVVMVTVRMMGMKRIMAPSLSMTRSDGLWESVVVLGHFIHLLSMCEPLQDSGWLFFFSHKKDKFLS